MGYYIEVPCPKNKTEQIIKLYNGIEIPRPKKFHEIPSDKALIIVVDNGPFEAAGYAYSEQEFLDFTRPDDNRPHRYILIDKILAKRLV